MSLARLMKIQKCCWADVVVGECSREEARMHVYTNSHTHTRWRCRAQPRTVGRWVIPPEGLRGQCLAQGHFRCCSWGGDEYYMLGLSTSGIKHKLSCLGLFFISRRSNVSHYVKLLIRQKHFLWQCQWAVFTPVSSLTHGLSFGRTQIISLCRIWIHVLSHVHLLCRIVLLMLHFQIFLQVLKSNRENRGLLNEI